MNNTKWIVLQAFVIITLSINSSITMEHEKNNDSGDLRKRVSSRVEETEPLAEYNVSFKGTVAEGVPYISGNVEGTAHVVKRKSCLELICGQCIVQ